MSMELVNPDDSAVALTAEQKKLVLSHFVNHRAPAVVFNRLWPTGAPCSFTWFKKLYVDAIVEYLSLGAENAMVALPHTLEKGLKSLETARERLESALETCCFEAKEYAAIATALVRVNAEIRALRAHQLQESAALHQLLYSNAGADDGQD